MIGIDRHIGRHAKPPARLQNPCQMPRRAGLHETALVVTRLRPGIGEKQEDPVEHRIGHAFEFVARVWSGTVEYFSGLLAKVSPGSTTFITPTGEITPKGTHFVIKVDDAPWPDEFAPAADRGAGA